MFYTYYQNNSGGRIYDNEDVGQYVVIEGDNLGEINNKAKSIFENYMDFCPCCGERWEDLDYECEDGLDDFPSILNFEDRYWKGRSIIVYYEDGRKEFHKHK